MGLLSSFHCIGMCGPIALALPVHRGNKFQQFAGLTAYNTGRAITYSALGILTGTLATSLVWIGYFRYMSVGAGVLLLCYVLYSSRLEKHFNPPLFWQKQINRLKSGMKAMLGSKSFGGWFLLGSLNGLLPCGMVYLALVSSMATGSISGSATFMLLFGVGTWPMMMLTGYFKNLITPALRTRMRRLVPVMLSVAGIWLVVRGLAIEYPTTTKNNSIPVCHSSAAEIGNK
ncbi:hypothetical protein DYBT9275_03328 [Dyadobacter sp. CECT 9275]|uniref:Urease accessory protein UreH-like transmembrane domain-containing protein n=2 Tax=Dyadobacter helix TaxID=2822344 RepID=A0A916JEP8_9BACT|nr:hypothetical protein DYBT9275_03328 [Dyadobacter sp. CECT 9275]